MREAEHELSQHVPGGLSTGRAKPPDPRGERSGAGDGCVYRSKAASEESLKVGNETKWGAVEMSKKIYLTVNKLNRAQQDAVERIVQAESRKVQRRCQWIMFLAWLTNLALAKNDLSGF